MPHPPQPTPEEPDDHDDAALLWSDEPESPTRASSAPNPNPAAPRVAPGESYDLTEPEPGVEGDAPRGRRPVPPPIDDDDEPPVRRPSRRPEEEDAGGDRARDGDDVVDVVYSRWAEWRSTILRLAALGVGTLILAYFSLDLGSFEVTAVLLLLAMALGVVLAYPILVTLEPPLRLTPEQAVRDYFGALEHYIPQTRRMWLLLSRGGRQSSRFASFEGFQRYWDTRLAALRGSDLSSWTPLVFEVVEYRGDKSAGLDEVTARFTVRVSARGHRADGPIASIPVQSRLMRGPDRQWYLRDGMLPET